MAGIHIGAAEDGWITEKGYQLDQSIHQPQTTKKADFTTHLHCDYTVDLVSPPATFLCNQWRREC